LHEVERAQRRQYDRARGAHARDDREGNCVGKPSRAGFNLREGKYRGFGGRAAGSSFGLCPKDLKSRLRAPIVNKASRSARPTRAARAWKSPGLASKRNAARAPKSVNELASSSGETFSGKTLSNHGDMW
jgi:hypothetical protein